MLKCVFIKLKQKVYKHLLQLFVPAVPSHDLTTSPKVQRKCPLRFHEVVLWVFPAVPRDSPKSWQRSWCHVVRDHAPFHGPSVEMRKKLWNSRVIPV